MGVMSPVSTQQAVHPVPGVLPRVSPGWGLVLAYRRSLYGWQADVSLTSGPLVSYFWILRCKYLQAKGTQNRHLLQRKQPGTEQVKAIHVLRAQRSKDSPKLHSAEQLLSAVHL